MKAGTDLLKRQAVNPSTVVLAGLILLPAAGLVAWAWHAAAQVERDMQALGGFDEAHFEIGPMALPGPEAAR
jgi:hypothetical protein